MSIIFYQTWKKLMTKNEKEKNNTERRCWWQTGPPAEEYWYCSQEVNITQQDNYKVYLMFILNFFSAGFWDHHCNSLFTPIWTQNPSNDIRAKGQQKALLYLSDKCFTLRHNWKVVLIYSITLGFYEHKSDGYIMQCSLQNPHHTNGLILLECSFLTVHFSLFLKIKCVAALRSRTAEMNCSVHNTHCYVTAHFSSTSRECYSKSPKGILFHYKLINLEAQLVLHSLNSTTKIELDPVCFGQRGKCPGNLSLQRAFAAPEQPEVGGESHSRWRI